MKWCTLIRDQSLREPLVFLGLFLLVASLSFLLREVISAVYLPAVVPVVNWLFEVSRLPVEFERQDHVLLLVYREFGLQFRVHDIVYQNMMVAVALFAATPGQSLRWKVRWIAGVVVLLWTTHVFSLYTGGHTIVWDYLESLPPEQQQGLLPKVAEVFSPERDWLFSRLFGVWHTWGRPTLALLVWFFAARGYLRLREADSGPGGK